MKKTLYLLMVTLLVGCSSDDVFTDDIDYENVKYHNSLPVPSIYTAHYDKEFHVYFDKCIYPDKCRDGVHTISGRLVHDGNLEIPFTGVWTYTTWSGSSNNLTITAIYQKKKAKMNCQNMSETSLGGYFYIRDSNSSHGSTVIPEGQEDIYEPFFNKSFRYDKIYEK